MARLTASLLMLAAGTMADEDSPLRFRGTFSGTRTQRFAQANPAVANSLECVTGNNQVTIQGFTVNVTQNGYTQSGTEPFNVTIAGTPYVVPATPARSLGWANLTTDGILTLRTDPTTVECYYARMTGSGNNRQITIVTLGGGSITFAQQCDPAVYQRIPDVWNTPMCNTPGDGTRAPLNSTVITKVNYQGGGFPDTGSGASTPLIAGASAVAAAAAMLLF